MLYKITEIKEDKDLLKGKNLTALAKACPGATLSYLSLLLNKKRIASEEVYKQIKKALHEKC